ncbi:MAG TPA: aminoglycoside phosphotransferase family protein [Thermomicrobiales bacterium]|nr:aminoglycoside phosphotransferase family protein [Thermomicrobiales bacterium]
MTAIPAIPADFARRMVEVYGEAGAAWLRDLPGLVAACARRWALTVLPPFDLTYNYVAPAVRAGGEAVVLKVGYPGRELMAELAALRVYDGRGCARLLDADPAHGAMLLERLMPGTPLARLAATDDEAATTIAAGVMRALWRPAPEEHPFPTITDWGAGFGRLRAEFDGGAGPFPAALVAEAERLCADLLATQATPVVLHGDLHHGNILAAGRAPWLALDPKGVVGEPAYEVGALLRNPMPDVAVWSRLDRVLARRLDILAAELGLDRARLRAWSLTQAVLSAWWSYEDHGHGWEPAIACAEALRE